MSVLTVGSPRRVTDGDVVRVIADVEGSESLWFSVPREFEGLLSDRSDYLAVGLLVPAMRRGQDLHVGGVVTDTLLYRLNHDAQRLLQAVNSELGPIRVTATEVLPSGLPQAGVATGFSGGVDSLGVLAEFALADNVPRALKITHLLMNNVGSHRVGGRDLWRERVGRLRPAAEAMGLPLVAVDSNLEVHYQPMGFVHTVTPRNAAVAHLLAGGIGRLHYASGFSYEQVGVPENGHISRADPLTLPLLSTAAVTIEPAGTGSSRVDKTLSLIGRPEARWLDVCVAADPGPTGNCSACWKCMRTMLTIDIAGELDSFCPVPFQREPYERGLPAYLADVLGSPDPLSQEVVEFARQRGWKWRRSTRARAVFRRADAALRGTVWAARKRLRRLAQ